MKHTEILNVKIKKLIDSAVIPTYAHETDAGLDLVATLIETDEYGNTVCHTGLAIEIPVGYVGLLFPRSSVSKYAYSLCNCVGVIDSAYRGEIILKYNNLQKISCYGDLLVNEKSEYNIGDRVGQLIIMPYPRVYFIESNELSETDRADKGFGSSGK